MEILCYISGDAVGALAASLPGAVVAENEGLPLEKPKLALVQLSTEARGMLALQLVRKRIPVALLGASDCGYLKGLMSSARRNRTPVFLLESWRYIPAVAAAKEICVSGCLGELRVCRIAAPCHGELEMARIQDVADWLGGKLVFTETQEGVHLLLDAQNGTIDAAFSLDGQQAQFTVTIAGHRHSRIIPKANPLLSELAVLSLAVKAREKVREISLLMGKFSYFVRKID